jgi:hypothetical protein
VCKLDHEHSLFLAAAVEEVTYIRLDHGLTVLFSRPAWYLLVDSARDGVVVSGDYKFLLSSP